MLSLGKISVISLIFLAFPYCLAARAQILRELETQPVSHIFPSSRNGKPSNPTLVQGAIADPFIIYPRIGARYESSGSGYDGLVQLNGFLPIAQTPEQDLLFIQGNINFDRSSRLGMNALLGYRFLFPEETKRLWGMYAGFDSRTTGSSTFNQIGLGIESLGDLDFRLNGYIPIGNIRNQYLAETFQSSSDTGLQASNPRFSGNSLLFDLFRQTTTSTTERRFYEAALGGFDLEIGGKLFTLGDIGTLRGYGGLYYYAENGFSRQYVGWQARLEARLLEHIQLGVGVQDDGLFGTNWLFNVGVTWGGSRSRSPETETILARLGESVQRKATITVDRQIEESTEATQSTEQETVAATNPTTGEAWRFLHVTGGATGSNCTVEAPCGQVTEAIAIALTAGNDLVYVDAGTNPGLNGFTIADNLQVLSTAITRSLEVQVTSTSSGTETLTVQLPGSGTGTLPLINGTTVTTGGLTGMVSIGNNSTLSGFDIQITGNNNNGVIASNVDGFTIDQNQITTTGDNARGIFTYANSSTISSATISGNTIATSGEDAYGIFTYATGTGAIANQTLSSNRITTTGDTGKGVYIKSNNNSSLETVTISGNTISTAGNTNAFGLQVNVGTTTLSSVNISGNTVSTPGNQATGIYVRAQNANGTIGSATISGNTVTTTGNYSEGISLTASGPNATITSGTISGNLISTGGSYADGIFIQTLGGNSIVASGTVTDNIINQAGAHSVVIQARNGTETICIAQFTGNTSGMPNIFGSGGNDLNFNPSAGTPGTINFIDFTNVSTNNTGFDDIFIANGTITPVTSC